MDRLRPLCSVWAVLIAITALVAVTGTPGARAQSATDEYIVYQPTDSADFCGAGKKLEWDIYASGSCEYLPSYYEGDVRSVKRFCDNGTAYLSKCTDGRCKICRPAEQLPNCTIASPIAKRGGLTFCRLGLPTLDEVGNNTLTATYYDYNPNVTYQNCKGTWYHKWVRPGTEVCVRTAGQHLGTWYTVNCDPSGNGAGTMLYWSESTCSTDPGKYTYRDPRTCSADKESAEFTFCGDYRFSSFASQSVVFSINLMLFAVLVFFSV